ncbi:triphosphoribosyl-dephospho-CoA synthase [Gordonia sp. CPCC 205515]|uniref:triphosphoribosyl-dephospho-CoA synthase n=1 Tax=Gordonia sp. CPCC 205515 TaxID=3140791 RepID=UPI003AF3C39C
MTHTVITDMQTPTSLLADAAVAALCAEATLSPKPGLVDARGSGAHTDMDLDLLLRSAQVLRPTFTDLAAAGLAGGTDLPRLRADLAGVGRVGERTMMAATGGVNTHRGAIWALGLTVGAAASLAPESGAGSAAAILDRVAAIAAHDDPAAPAPHTPGARARAHYAVGGAVGAARAGFPAAVAALMSIRGSRLAGATEEQARLDGLLAAMTDLDDTCVLVRGGRSALHTVRSGARRALAVGGARTPAGRAVITELDRRLCATGISPGGSADMLALALLLDELDTATPPDGRVSDQGRRRRPT